MLATVDEDKPYPPPSRRSFVASLAWQVGAWFVISAMLIGIEWQQASAADLQRLSVWRYALAIALGFAIPMYAGWWLIDRLDFRPLSVRLAACMAMLVGWGVIQWIMQPWLGFELSLVESVFSVCVVPGVGIIVREAWKGLRASRQLALTREMRAVTEQRLLGAQLAPHTLFNMLNTLYAVSMSQPERLVPLVRDLSEMMRGLIASDRRNMHPASEEWRFIEAYRRFALARASEDSRIVLCFEGDPNRPVPAYLIATLFENAVKHGIDADGRLDVEVLLRIEDGGFVLSMRNRVAPEGVSAPGLQAGMTLVRRQLEYLYAGRHRLDVGVRDGWFEVGMEAAE